MQNLLSLTGKHALVTGGTAGIGRAIAESYAQAGADVTIVGTNPERGAEVVTALKGIGDGNFAFCKIDVSDNQAVQECLGKLSQIDILVNCAGITADKLFMRMSEDDWDRVMNINLKSVYNFCSFVVKTMMKKRNGRIINITSVVGLTGNPGQANYAASKAGMVGFTKSLGKEVASRGITVNAIAPGFIETKMTGALNDEQKETLLKTIPMKKMGRPEDIAYAALYLASDMAQYVTGQTIVVDGGMIA